MPVEREDLVGGPSPVTGRRLSCGHGSAQGQPDVVHGLARSIDHRVEAPQIVAQHPVGFVISFHGSAQSILRVTDDATARLRVGAAARGNRLDLEPAHRTEVVTLPADVLIPLATATMTSESSLHTPVCDDNRRFDGERPFRAGTEWSPVIRVCVESVLAQRLSVRNIHPTPTRPTWFSLDSSAGRPAEKMRRPGL